MPWQVVIVSVKQVLSYSEHGWLVVLVELIVGVLPNILNAIAVCVVDLPWLPLGLEHYQLVRAAYHLNIVGKLALDLGVCFVFLVSGSLLRIVDQV